MVRKNQPLVTVRSESFTDVAEGETITTLLLDAVSMDDNEPPENWAPTIASTWFVVISFVAAAAAAWEFVWSSSLNITIGCPRTPPAALISCAARFAPFVSPGPYGDSPPVSDNSVPIRSAGFPAGVKSPPSTAANTTTMITTMTATAIHTALLFGAAFGAAPAGTCCSSIMTPAASCCDMV